MRMTATTSGFAEGPVSVLFGDQVSRLQMVAARSQVYLLTTS
jgi:hypothetical protein